MVGKAAQTRDVEAMVAAMSVVAAWAVTVRVAVARRVGARVAEVLQARAAREVEARAAREVEAAEEAHALYGMHKFSFLPCCGVVFLPSKFETGGAMEPES